MNGVHDMGGMHGFGAVDVDDDARFHADWERAAFAIDRILRAGNAFNVDEKRHAIERMDPADYLNSSYFERWIDCHERLLVEKGLLEPGEVDERLGAAVPEREDPDLAAAFREAFETPAAYDREPQEPRFEAGDAVRVRNDHPAGHTRCPRYARRATGTVDEHRGTHVLPDASAHGEEAAEPLYTVRFSAGELWGEDAERDDAMYLDCWEPYLEPADP